MIQYALKCAEGHVFDSWFQSAEAYDRLAQSGHVTCSVCGASDVDKAIMAPRVGTGREAVPDAPLTGPVNPTEKALAEMRSKIEKESDYVGGAFASEARAMHLGDAPKRAIYGEAGLDEARKLIDDGIKVAPLPFVPNRKTN
ncbi:MAG: DUF1178 family protein [Sedimentitalea sp.]